jgi:hypothetical protein
MRSPDPQYAASMTSTIPLTEVRDSRGLRYFFCGAYSSPQDAKSSDTCARSLLALHILTKVKEIFPTALQSPAGSPPVHFPPPRLLRLV